MGFVPANPDFERRTRESFDKQGAMTLIGAVLEKVEPGRVEIALPFRADLSQQHGFFHAGMLSAIADTAGGFAGFTLFPPEGAVLTVEFKINLMAAADGERLHAVGEVIRSGRTLTVCRLDVFVVREGKRTHCATGLQTLMCLVGRSGVSG